MSFPTKTTVLPPIHYHPSPLTTLAPHLLPRLPYSLPLLRCLQHHISTSPTAHVFATFPPGTSPLPIDPSTGQSRPFAALFVDRARAPETECWVFSSWETRVVKKTLRTEQDGGNEGEDNAERSGEVGRGEVEEREEEDEEGEEEARLQILALFSAVARLGEGYEDGDRDGIEQDQSQGQKQRDAGDGRGGMEGNRRREGQGKKPRTDLLVTGSLSETLLPLLAGQDLPYLQPVPVLGRDIESLREQLAVARKTMAPVSGKEDENENENEVVEKKKEEEKKRKGILCSTTKPYVKWLISSPTTPPRPAPSATTAAAIKAPPSQQAKHPPPLPPLPPNYTFSPILRTELPHIIALTTIPRTETTLASLDSIGVRYHPPPEAAVAPLASDSDDKEKKEKEEKEGQLIANSFLSPDGSLSTLHVLPPHRGKGIAKAVCTYLIHRLLHIINHRIQPQSPRQDKDNDDDDDDDEDNGKGVWDEGMVHSDVSEENVASAGVARGLGGRVGWRVRWVGVDLVRVREVCGGGSG